MLRWSGGHVVWAAIAFLLMASPVLGAGSGHAPSTDTIEFPRSLDSYGDEHADGLGTILLNRIRLNPFNFAATAIFFAAIWHTFLTSRFLKVSHR